MTFSEEAMVFEMKLQPAPFRQIKSGRKTVELRLFDEKRSRISIGDTIVFSLCDDNSQKITAKVTALHRFESFSELYKTIPLLKCGYTEGNISDASPSDMEKYYPRAEQEKYGVLGIEFIIPEEEKMINIGKVFILGDSYSTFEGCIPEGFATYYSKESTESGVTSPDKTWWGRLVSETESELIRNCSFSGTTVCHTGYNGSDCREISFVSRMEKLYKSGYFKENRPDTLFVFGGTNDTWAGSPVGELDFGERSAESLYMALPAFCELLAGMKKELPDTHIYCIINICLSDAIRNGYLEACRHYGIKAICPTEIDMNGGHPTSLGMEQIKDSIIAALGKE